MNEKNVDFKKTPKICINFVNESYFIWKAEDVYEMRKNCRIVGTLVGCLPRVPFQNNQLGLPLRLMPEEAHLLKEKGLGIITACPNLQQPVPTEVKDKIQELREKIFIEQNEQFKEERRKTILSKADIIVAGKKRRLLENSLGTLSKKKRKMLQNELEKESSGKDKIKLSDEYSGIDIIDINKNVVIEEELNKISNVPKESLWVQILSECPWSNNVTINTHYPSNEIEKIRFLVFKDLWEKGHYITCGSKFGGDFLSYPGDPAKFHAWWVIHCVTHAQPIDTIDILTKGRLGTQVRKNIVLATIKPDLNIDYITLKWAGD